MAALNQPGYRPSVLSEDNNQKPTWYCYSLHCLIIRCLINVLANTAVTSGYPNIS